jgi:predicted MFS family arabinose efflux permease
MCYGALQNLTLIVAFAAVAPQQLPAASAVWNIGFDTGTAAGAVLAGVLATAYSFPVSLATMAAFCLIIAVVAVLVPSPQRTPVASRRDGSSTQSH